MVTIQIQGLVRVTMLGFKQDTEVSQVGMTLSMSNGYQYDQLTHATKTEVSSLIGCKRDMASIF